MTLKRILLAAVLLPGLALTACKNNSNNDAAGGGADGEKPAQVVIQSSGGGDISAGTQVASINGQAVTYGELQAEAEFASVLAKFETEQAQRRYQLQSSGLTNLVNERLLEMEAKALGKTKEQYVTEEVTSKIATPTDAEIEEMYKRFQRRMRGTLEENREQLIERYKQQEDARLRQELVTKLREKYKVDVTLPYPELPRLPVTVDDDPAFGSASAPVTIVEFSEFQCPYCRRVVPTMKQIKDAYGDQVRVVFRDFPLEFHQFAAKASEAGECADDQGKFWEMHDHLFENQRALAVEDLKKYATDLGLNAEEFASCLDSGKYAAEVTKDQEDGKGLGVTGTPTFFINGQMISGALPFDMFKAIIDSEIARAKK